MIYTNNYNIPVSIEKAIINDAYQKEGRFTVTELIKPPQMRVLEDRYKSEITVDVSDGLWRLLGQSVHYILEQGKLYNHIAEKRLGVDAEGVRITGKIDLYSGVEKKVIDYKVTSVWSFMFGDKPEWEAQLNLYRLLYENAGFPVNGLEIHAILRDWHQSKVNGNGYPEIPFKRVEIPMWDRQKAWDYLEERVRLHLSSDQIVDEELPSCTSKEKWERAEKFAVMKKGQKRAVRVLDTEHDAENYLSEIAVEIKGKGNKGNGYYIQHRPGEAVRCNSYCRVKDFCKQYQRESVEF